jgi:uncharacterized protein
MHHLRVFLKVAALVFPLLLISSAVAQTCDAKPLTGSKTGYSYKLGMAIRQVASTNDKRFHLNLCVFTTDENLDNIQRLEEGEVDFAIAQSDVAHDAWYRHPPRFRDDTNAPVSLVMPLYLEAVHILIRPDLEISRPEDLQGKKVGVYLSNSGTEYTAKHILTAVGLESEAGSTKTFTAVNAPGPEWCESLGMLAERRLDALFRVTVVPSLDMKDALKGEASANCPEALEFRLLPLGHDLAERLARDGSYTETLIPKTAYNQNESTLTVGVQALLLAGKSAHPEDVAKLAKIIRYKHAEIESALKDIANAEHAGHEHRQGAGIWSMLTPRPTLSLSLLDVSLPHCMMKFVPDEAKPFLYHWWRDSWKSELTIFSVMVVLFGFIWWQRAGIGRVMQNNPNLTFGILGTFLIWFVAACVLYYYGGVDEHFNSFSRSLISTFLYLASFPGYALLNQDAESFAEAMKWVSVVMLGGFASPLLKQGLDRLLAKTSKSLQNTHCESARSKGAKPTLQPVQTLVVDKNAGQLSAPGAD